MLHNLILDILRGRFTPPEMILAPHVDRVHLARQIRGAEVFVFEDIPLEPENTGDMDGFWRIPSLTPEENEMFKEGLIPLPSDYCWYEFTIHGKSSGLLVSKHPQLNDICVLRVDYTAGFKGIIDGIWTTEKDGQTMVFGNQKDIKQLKELGTIDKMGYPGNYGLARYLTMMLNSKTTETVVRLKRERTAEEKARNRHGLPAHRVVTIVPTRFVQNEHQGGTHASPRLHWRRSHVRVYRAPSGAEYHRTVVVRHLVGKAEIGTVTHEYKVKS